MVVIKAHHQCHDAAPRHPHATQHQPWIARSFPPKARSFPRSKKSARMCRRPGRGTWPRKHQKARKPERQVHQRPDAQQWDLEIIQNVRHTSTPHVSMTHVEPNVFFIFYVFHTKMLKTSFTSDSASVKARQSIRVPGFTSVSTDCLEFPATSMCRFPSARSWLPT